MKQAIPGVAAPELGEVKIMSVWPSNAAYPIGKALGRYYSIQHGFYVLRIGNLIALPSIPIALLIYFWRILPFVGTRYTLTNKRVIVQKGLSAVDSSWVDLDRFDDIEVEVLPGQEWYFAGDLVFKRGDDVTLRLPGVSRPESFRQVCMKAHNSHVGVKSALQAAGA